MITCTKKLWFLKDFDLFEEVDHYKLNSVSERFKMISSKKGDVLKLSMKDGPLVYFIKVGAVKIVNCKTGHVRSVLNRGNIFGETAIYEEEDNCEEKEEAIVLESSLICLITVAEMEMIFENLGSIKNKLLKLYGSQVRELHSNIEDLLYKSSETRITEYIIRYIKEFGHENDGTYQARNLLSHKDIAHLTYTSRQTVSNVMSKLRKSGMIDYNTKKISFKLGTLPIPPTKPK